MNESEKMDSAHCTRSYELFLGKGRKPIAITVGKDSEARSFRFPIILPESATQEDAFEPAKELIDSALEGSKCSIFAYGQTGSGKTYTLSGGSFKKNGIVQQTFHYIEKKLRADELITDCGIKCMMIQVYKSDIVDLLRSDEKTAKALEI